MKKQSMRDLMRIKFMTAFELPEQEKVWKWIETNMSELEARSIEVGYIGACRDCANYTHCDECKSYVKEMKGKI